MAINRNVYMPQIATKHLSPLVELAYKDHLDLFLPELWELLSTWGPNADVKVISRLEEVGIL